MRKSIIFLALFVALSLAVSAGRSDIVGGSGTQMRVTEGETVTLTYYDVEYILVIDKVEGDYVTLHMQGGASSRIREGDSAVFSIDETIGLLVDAVAVIGKDVNMRFRKIERIIEPVATPISEPSIEKVVGSVVEEDNVQDNASEEPSKIPYMIAGVIGVFVFFLLVDFIRKRR